MKQPKVILVNQEYPADCLIFKALINANQSQYRVSGHEDVLVIQQSPMPAPSSDTSLQLKSKKGDNAPPQQTPSRTEGSEHPYISRVPEDADLAKKDRLRRKSITSPTGGGEQTLSDVVTDNAEPMGVHYPQRASTHTQASPQNELDQAIEEAQATKDLVSIGKFDCAGCTLIVS